MIVLQWKPFVIWQNCLSLDYSAQLFFVSVMMVSLTAPISIPVTANLSFTTFVPLWVEFWACSSFSFEKLMGRKAVLEKLIIILFPNQHSVTSSMDSDGFRSESDAVFDSTKSVVSSAYLECVSVGSLFMSIIKMMKSSGDRKLPCGRPSN